MSVEEKKGVNNLIKCILICRPLLVVSGLTIKVSRFLTAKQRVFGDKIVKLSEEDHNSLANIKVRYYMCMWRTLDKLSTRSIILTDYILKEVNKQEI
ncbi:MAG: hypothetical protein ACRCX2_39010 [Paraclostridium sp.]